MLPSTAIATFYHVFNGREIPFSYPCARMLYSTYILVQASHLELAREVSQKIKLPSPVVPVVLEDVKEYRKPIGNWIRVCQKGVFLMHGEHKLMPEQYGPDETVSAEVLGLDTDFWEKELAHESSKLEELMKYAI